MERRDPVPGSRVEQSKEQSKTDTSQTWQAVRRALGRLVSRVGVRRIEDDARTIPAAVLRSELALPPPLSQSPGWQPSASAHSASVPQAGSGLHESDLVPSVTFALGNHALSPPETYAMPAAGAETLRVAGAALQWPAEVTELPAMFLRLPSSPVRTLPAPLLAAPKTTPLRGWPVQAPRTHPMRLPRFAEPRVRWGGDGVLRRMPLTRRGRAGDSSAGRRRLAETVHLGPDEVTLLGIYPDVPILAVERIVVEDEGRQLRLWLKPDVLRGRSGSHRITLLVGRQIATGKMLQAAL